MSTIALSSLIVSVPYLSLWPWVIRIWKQTHSRISKFNVMVMVAFLGCFQFAQYYLAWFGGKELLPGIQVNSGSSVLFPLSLAIVMQLYITRSVKVFRFVCLLLIATNLIAMFYAIAMRIGVGPEMSPELKPLWTDAAMIKIALGTLILFVDIFLMIGVFRHLQSLTANRYLNVALPLLASLILDSILFSAVVAFCDQIPYTPTLEIQLITKIAAGSIYAVCLTISFKQFDRDAIEKPQGSARAFWRETMLSESARAAAYAYPEPLALTRKDRLAIKPGMITVGKDAIATEDPQDLAQSALRRDWGRILEEFDGKWVALGPEGVITSAETDLELRAALSSLDLEQGSFIVRKIVPWLADSFELVVLPPHTPASPSPPGSRESEPDAIGRAETAMRDAWDELVAADRKGWAAFSEKGVVSTDPTYDGLLIKLHEINREDIIVRKLG